MVGYVHRVLFPDTSTGSQRVFRSAVAERDLVGRRPCDELRGLAHQVESNRTHRARPIECRSPSELGNPGSRNGSRVSRVASTRSVDPEDRQVPTVSRMPRRCGRRVGGCVRGHQLHFINRRCETSGSRSRFRSSKRSHANFAIHNQSDRSFRLRRRNPEQIKADIVPHDVRADGLSESLPRSRFPSSAHGGTHSGFPPVARLEISPIWLLLLHDGEAGSNRSQFGGRRGDETGSQASLTKAGL